MPNLNPELKLQLASGWRYSLPSDDAPKLLSEEGGRLCLLAGNLNLLHDFGAVGPVDCPLAYDAGKRLAYRYVCATGQMRGDFSQLRAFSVDRKESFPLKDLPPSQWALWFLEWVGSSNGEPGQLFGLLATDRAAEDQVVIEHRLFTYRPGDELLRLRPLCRDAYKPLAFSRPRREMIFAGADGIYLLNLRGERRLTLPSDAAATGQGAIFSPDGSPRVVVGGDGLHLWNLEKNTCSRLTRNGRHPVWSPDGKGIWYRESSSDLQYYDFERDESQQVIALADVKYLDFWHARPASLSSCGRFLATCLSQKLLRGVSKKGSATGERERVYVHEHMFCVMDLERRTYWFREGFANQLCWVG